MSLFEYSRMERGWKNHEKVMRIETKDEDGEVEKEVMRMDEFFPDVTFLPSFDFNFFEKLFFPSLFYFFFSRSPPHSFFLPLYRNSFDNLPER